MIKALVFDFDGLILDTETPEYESFQWMYKGHGVELPLEVWAQCVGTDNSVFEPYAYLEQCLGQPYDREKARMLRRQRHQMIMEDQVPRPGVEDYLERAQALGLQIGLASSSSREWVTGYLNQYGLLDYFQCIRTQDDVERVKPDPALYIQAMKGLGVMANESIAFEDSPNGALAAKTAGMRCVIVPNTITSTFTFGAFDYRLDSMSSMPLDELLAELQG